MIINNPTGGYINPTRYDRIEPGDQGEAIGFDAEGPHNLGISYQDLVDRMVKADEHYSAFETALGNYTGIPNITTTGEKQ